MFLIQWNDALSIRIDEIDQQDKKLTRMINDLNDSGRLGLPASEHVVGWTDGPPWKEMPP